MNISFPEFDCLSLNPKEYKKVGHKMQLNNKLSLISRVNRLNSLVIKTVAYLISEVNNNNNKVMFKNRRITCCCS